MNKPFTILILFCLLSLLGISFLPYLDVKLKPSNTAPRLTVSYGMDGNNEVLDSEVTTPLEGMLSSIIDVTKINSTTSSGSGKIKLTLDKDCDIDAVRFEVASIIRQLAPTFPKSVRTPTITTFDPEAEKESEQLLTYTINGPGTKSEISTMLEKQVSPILSDIAGVYKVYVHGADRLQWHLQYNENELEKVGIEKDDIDKAFSNRYFNSNLGMALGNSKEEYFPVVYSGLNNDSVNWDNLVVRKHKRTFILSDLVSINERIAKPQSYYRINGFNAVYLTINSTKDANQLVSGKLVKESLAKIRTQLPEGYIFIKTHDETTYIKTELQRIYFRVGLSLLLLMLFVFLVSRSGKYVFITSISILATLCIAFILYYFFKVEIHIYSMAGITVSLGIIIDNSIIMTDHLKYHNNKKVFMAILASTLTTIASLTIIFFLDDNQKLRLLDFAYVLTINLSVSLIVALLLIPAMAEKMNIHKNRKAIRPKTTRRIIRFNTRYYKIVSFFKRHKVVAIIFIVLLFGLPTFKLPTTIREYRYYYSHETRPQHSELYNNVRLKLIRTYNNTIGSSFYNENLRTPINYTFGGLLRIFSTSSPSGRGSAAIRTSISIRGSLPKGATLEQMNNIIIKVENFLAQYDGIEQYISNVRSPQSGNIFVSFKPKAEFSSLPHTVLNEVQSFCSDIGNPDWTITGKGRRFDNSINEGRRDSRISLYGYNLEQLKKYAADLEIELDKIQRVDGIFIDGKGNYMDRVGYEYKLNMKDQKLIKSGIDRGRLIKKLKSISKDETPGQSLYDDNNILREVILAKSNTDNSVWNFYNKAVQLSDNQHIKVNDIGSMKKERTKSAIEKENMQYKIVVEFNFTGSGGQKQAIVGDAIEMFAPYLPIGYRMKAEQFYGSYWGSKTESNKQLWLILLILVIIYFICAILLESLLQPLAVIAMIPLSFIGIFIIFSALKLPFDDGGYASMLLLSGLTVNSTLYIINDFNNLLKQKVKPIASIRQYIKAYNHKIIPILLTIFSTVLGLIPFLFGGQKDAFWFSLAVGTMGGLVFSIIGLFFYLPLFLRITKRKGKRVTR